ncbi:MAG: UDP-N-acetylmuramoyl-L-alanine--D-glutamate ligase [Phycisphaerae bacterium]
MKKRHIVIMGLGRFGGGIGVARWYALQGERVTVTDQLPPEKLTESITALADLPVEFKLGGHPENLLNDCDLLVVSPAVDKRRSAFFQSARARGVPWTTEINEFCRRCPALVVGITGSVGKSTTASMIFAALKAVRGEGRCHLGGNIGRSLLGQIPEIRSDHVVVLELSSFMLEDTPMIGFSPHIAVVTNLVNNHLDRHGTMEAYAAAKLNILRFQKSDDIAILNRNDPQVSTWNQHTHGKVIYFDYADLALQVPGRHNQANAAAALAVIKAFDGEKRIADAIAALEAFRSLPHRMELVGQSTNYLNETVDWLNDSKSTTPESTLTAVSAVPAGRTIVIVGGADKNSDMRPLAGDLVGRSWGIITIGATGPKIAGNIRNAMKLDNGGESGSGYRAQPMLMELRTLEQAVEQAHRWTTEKCSPNDKPAPVCVLLSPACASYDQFSNYEHRGAVFKELVSRVMQFA